MIDPLWQFNQALASGEHLLPDQLTMRDQLDTAIGACSAVKDMLLFCAFTGEAVAMLRDLKPGDVIASASYLVTSYYRAAVIEQPVVVKILVPADSHLFALPGWTNGITILPREQQLEYVGIDDDATNVFRVV